MFIMRESLNEKERKQILSGVQYLKEKKSVYIIHNDKAQQR